MDMSQGDLFQGDDDSESDSSDDSKPQQNPLKNLEDFEKRALQDDSQSIPVNSLPVDNLMNVNSSKKLNEFNMSPGSLAYPDKNCIDQAYGSLNSEKFQLDWPEQMNSLHASNVKLLQESKAGMMTNAFGTTGRPASGSNYGSEKNVASVKAFSVPMEEYQQEAKPSLMPVHRQNSFAMDIG